MNKIFLFVACLCLLCSMSNAQSFVWAKSLGRGNGKTSVAASSIADSNGNVYITGYYNGTVDFDPGNAVYNMTPVNGSDVFVAKYNAAGDFIWAKSMGGRDEDIANQIILDANGNVIITGYFTYTSDFDPGPAADSLVHNARIDADVFIVKLDSAGNYSWGKAIGGKSYETGNTLATDAQSNIFIAGQFTDTVDFDPGPGIHLMRSGSTDHPQAFVLALDASGNYRWVKGMFGTSMFAGSYPWAIAISASGEICVGGRFEDKVVLDPGNTSDTLKPGTGNGHLFIFKLNSAGTRIWTDVFTSNRYYSDVKGLCIDKSGNIFATGSFTGTIDFDPGPGVHQVSQPDYNDVFILRLTAAGAYSWVKTLSCQSTAVGQSVFTDTSGCLYTSGYFKDKMDFDPGPGIDTITPDPDNRNTYVLKLDQSGNHLWARNTGGSTTGRTMSMYGNRDIYLAGTYAGIVDFDPGPSVFNLSATNGAAMFVSKMQSCVSYISRQPSPATIYNGDSVVFTIASTAGASAVYRWELVSTMGDVFPLSDNLVVSGSSNDTLVMRVVAASYNGSMLRCVVSDGACVSISNTALLTVNCRPLITLQPHSISAAPGVDARFIINFSSYMQGGFWLLKTDSGEWPLKRLNAYTSSDTLIVPNVSAANDGWQIFFEASDGGCITASDTVLLHVHCPHIIAPPQSRTVAQGLATSFAVASNAIPLSYQWQLANGGTFTDLGDNSTYTGTDSDTLRISIVTAALDQTAYRCIVNATGCADTSAAAVLTAGPHTGLNEPSTNAVHVYPNPVEHMLFIDAAEAGSYSICNVLGVTVRAGNISRRSVSVDVSDLAPGMYILRTGAGQIRFLKKF